MTLRDMPTHEPIARALARIACGDLGVHEHTAAADGHIRFMACGGDEIEFVAAVDGKGRGSLVAAGKVR